jgi:hypothetical protein
LAQNLQPGVYHPLDDSIDQEYEEGIVLVDGDEEAQFLLERQDTYQSNLGPL